jgi:hypothetical protein
MTSPPSSSSRSISLPSPRAPSSLSLSNHWEAIVIGNLFRIRRRESQPEQEICQLPKRSIADEIPVTIAFPKDRFSITAQHLQDEPSLQRSTEEEVIPTFGELCEMRRGQVLDRTTQTLLRNIPQGAQLEVRSAPSETCHVCTPHSAHLLSSFPLSGRSDQETCSIPSGNLVDDLQSSCHSRDLHL